MTLKAKRLARRLLRQNRGTAKITARSWRVIARDDYQDRINFATLNRFALSQGDWLPKDESALIALGLKRERKAHHPHALCLFDMATSVLRRALDQRESMPPVDPRILRQFAKLGWLHRAGAR